MRKKQHKILRIRRTSLFPGLWVRECCRIYCCRAYVRFDNVIIVFVCLTHSLCVCICVLKRAYRLRMLSNAQTVVSYCCLTVPLFRGQKLRRLTKFFIAWCSFQCHSRCVYVCIYVLFFTSNVCTGKKIFFRKLSPYVFILDFICLFCWKHFVP